MESTLLSLLCVTFLAYGQVESNDSLTAVIDLVRSLDKDLRQLKMDIPQIEGKLTSHVVMSELSLRAELMTNTVPSFITRRVRDTLADIFKDKSLEDMVSSHLISEMSGLKVRLSKFKRQHQHMFREIGQLKIERSVYKDKLVKLSVAETEHVEILNGLNDTLEKVKGDYSTLEAKYDELKYSVQHAETRLGTLESKNELTSNDLIDLNFTLTKVSVNASYHLEEVQRMKDMLDEHNDQLQYIIRSNNETSNRFDLIEANHERFQKVLKFMKEKHSSTPVPQHTTTPTPCQIVRSRLLISSYATRSTTLHELEIEGNRISTNPYFTATHVEAITYDPKNNAIIFSRYSPDGIYSTRLNYAYTSSLRTNIKSIGMTVDEGRQLLFFTTHRPGKTVSSMRTDGRNFTTIIDIGKYANTPMGITLDTRKRMVYMCNHDKLFSVTYEGRNIQILYSGRNIRGVALDVGRGLLYFNDQKTIMRRTLSEGNSVKIVKMDHIPINLRYYNNTVYSSSNLNTDIYAVYSNGAYRLATVEQGSVICLAA